MKVHFIYSGIIVLLIAFCITNTIHQASVKEDTKQYNDSTFNAKVDSAIVDYKFKYYDLEQELVALSMEYTMLNSVLNTVTDSSYSEALNDEAELYFNELYQDGKILSTE